MQSKNLNIKKSYLCLDTEKITIWFFKSVQDFDEAKIVIDKKLSPMIFRGKEYLSTQNPWVFLGILLLYRKIHEEWI